VAKVISQKVSKAKLSYVLYPFDRATTSKEGLHSPLKEVKKNSARERPMEREKVAEVLIDFIEKKNLGDEIPITLPQAKIFFEKASQRKKSVEIIPFILISSTEKGGLLDHLKRFLGRIGIIITVRIELPKEILPRFLGWKIRFMQSIKKFLYGMLVRMNMTRSYCITFF